MRLTHVIRSGTVDKTVVSQQCAESTIVSRRPLGTVLSGSESGMVQGLLAEVPLSSDGLGACLSLLSDAFVGDPRFRGAPRPPTQLIWEAPE
jgi:hypothetical protein